MGKTSEQLVDVVINEIIHGNTDDNNTEYLPTITTDKNVLDDISKKFIK
jgi:hypothetical protein